MDINIPVPMPDGSFGIQTIASCEPAMPWQDWWNKAESVPTTNNQEGEKPMYKCKSVEFNNASTIVSAMPVPVEATQRDFATARVNQIREKHDLKLRIQFFMDAEDTPRTARDLIEKIKSDDFSLDEKALATYEDNVWMYGNTFGIRWGKNKPDVKGYEAARQALKAEAQEVIDDITLGTVEEGRQRLNAFKNWTFQTA